MAANKKKQQDRKTQMVRIVCIFLAFLMVASAIFTVVQMLFPAQYMY